MMDSPEATKVYLQIRLFLKEGKKSKTPPTIQLYNNMGVSFIKRRRFAEALEVFNIGLGYIEDYEQGKKVGIRFHYHYMSDSGNLTPEMTVLLKSLKQTFLYNLAYLEEARGCFREAVRQYGRVLEKNPLMIEARLRVIWIYQRLGRGF